MTEEIRDLLVKARKYIRSAEVLRREGDYDSAVSRLYYAMFYCAEALLAARGFAYSTHRGLLSGFSQHLVKTGELPAEMRDWLRRAFDKRQLGDYESRPIIEEIDVQDLQRKAEQFVARARELLSRTDRA